MSKFGFDYGISRSLIGNYTRAKTPASLLSPPRQAERGLRRDIRPPSSSGLGYQVLILETGVQIPVGVLTSAPSVRANAALHFVWRRATGPNTRRIIGTNGRDAHVSRLFFQRSGGVRVILCRRHRR